MSELPMTAEERLAALERKVSMMWNGGGDLLGTEGYWQIGNSSSAGAQRFDQNGHQIATRGAETAGIFFVDKLYPNPNDLTVVNRLTGDTSATEASAFWRAISGSAAAFVSIYAGELPVDVGSVILHATASGGGGSVELNAQENQEADLSLSNTVLRLASIAGDPTVTTARRIWYDGNNDLFRGSVGGVAKTFLMEGDVGGGMTVKVKEADETVTSSTTLQNDDELWFAVAANEVWQFEGSMFIDTISSADFRFAVTGPSGAVGRVFAAYSDTAAFDAHVGAGDLGDTIDLQTANTGTLVRFWGGIHNGANAGNLQVQWAQRVSQGTATTVHAGSYIKYIQANV